MVALTDEALSEEKQEVPLALAIRSPRILTKVSKRRRGAQTAEVVDGWSERVCASMVLGIGCVCQKLSPHVRVG